MQETYRLVKHVGFSAEYVDSISPNDRKMYIIYHDKELEEIRKDRASQQGQGPTIGSPIGG